MEKLIFDSIPETIQDLGTGHSLVHLNVKQEADNQVSALQDLGTGHSLVHLNVKQEADNQFSALVVRVEHPVTRDRVIAAFIHAEFSDDAREAALRKGIASKTNADYVAFNKYSEDVKRWCTEAGIV